MQPKEEPFGTRNRNNVVTLCKKPRQCDLAACGSVALPYLLQAFGKLQDVEKIRNDVLRKHPEEVILGKVSGGYLNKSERK
jgi:hypothetical protein